MNKIILFLSIFKCINSNKTNKKIELSNINLKNKINELKLFNKQLQLQKLINNDDVNIIIVTGAPGTGKTMISCNEAIKQLKENTIKKIIITRPVITVQEDMGFLPGKLEEKMYPYMIPIYDYFLEHFTQDTLYNMIRIGKIEISPLAYMRGRTFKDSIIIADEMQNSTPKQMKMILTRIGENSKLIINGDLNQCDILNNEINGLEEITELLKNKYLNCNFMEKDGFAHVNLDNSCIKRSPIIEKILNLYNK